MSERKQHDREDMEHEDAISFFMHVMGYMLFGVACVACFGWLGWRVLGVLLD